MTHDKASEMLQTQASFCNGYDRNSVRFIGAGVSLLTACHTAIAKAITGDEDMLAASNELSASLFL